MNIQTEDGLPQVPELMLAAWQEVKKSIEQFHAISHSQQLLCGHTHAVQYNPKPNPHWNEAGHQKYGASKRCCAACGLIECGEEPYNPDAFSELSAMNGAEIIATFEIGCEFNRYIVPAIQTSVAGSDRYDEIWGG